MDAPNNTDDGPSLADLIEIEQLVGGYADPDEDETAHDHYSAEQLVLNRVGVGNSDVLVVQRSEIPLKVVNDLVTGWLAQNKSGDWPVDTLRWSARKRGKGNRSWFVATLDPADNVFRVWRVSRGGCGKVTPTVTEELKYRRKFELISD